MVVFAGLLAAACVLLCIARLHAVVAPLYVDPSELGACLEEYSFDVTRFRGHLPAGSRTEWEREFAELPMLPVAQREGLESELVGEFEFRISRWGAAPRSVARIGAIGGFLVGSLVLRAAMDGSVSDGAAVVSAFESGMGVAITAVFAGLALTALAASVHAECRKRVRRGRAQLDALLEHAHVQSVEMGGK